ncbi:MAG: 1,4-alpha-glucan branching protein GlgB [Candidatus Melainabacteria bacterium]|nr:1,4-alpha-glucan branching protein GlgB [Candidatus Melainabacteria bacterium]
MSTKELKDSAPVITDFDLHLFGEGTNYKIYEKMGAHKAVVNGKEGTHFAVWAPNANSVSVIGDFNKWDPSANKMSVMSSSGVWTLFIPGLAEGTLYKYHISSDAAGGTEKTDPFGFFSEVRPKTASIVYDLDKYKWNDDNWVKERKKRNALDAAISIYEVHLGSWMLVPEEENRWLTYRELADKLVDYLKDTGFTHVEFLPVSEHPLDMSWGYQITGYYATTSRFGTPEDFMFLVDKLHQAGIGVILDWVPAHFPKDGHGLGLFDGSHLYEHADPRQGMHHEWGTYVFNFGRHEVRNFLISNALFWFDKYHIDGLRVDAVASMLYLNYARKDGEWVANDYGGRENLEAISLLRTLNEVVYSEHNYALMIAEESTAWPQVARPTYLGGLGFGLKWDMGWMNDTLKYMSLDSIYRRYHHNNLTFRGLYQFSENFVMPLSHDEVVHGKCSLLNKMPGDHWQKFANLRLLLGYQWTLPGKKLLFMGGEFGQWIEWNYAQSLDWHLLEYPLHAGMKRWVSDLNHVYRDHPALFELDCNPAGFSWIDCQDHDQSILAYSRQSQGQADQLVIACNFTPVPRNNYRIGVPTHGFYKELLNSDASEYGGSGLGNFGGLHSDEWRHHGHNYSISITLPPLSMVVFKAEK